MCFHLICYSNTEVTNAWDFPSMPPCCSNVTTIVAKSVLLHLNVGQDTQEMSSPASRDRRLLKPDNTWVVISSAFRERSWSKGENVKKKIGKQERHFKWHRKDRRGVVIPYTNPKPQQEELLVIALPTSSLPLYKFPLLCSSWSARGPPLLHVPNCNFLLFPKKPILLEKYLADFV